MPLAKTSQPVATPKIQSSKTDVSFISETPINPEFYRYFNLDANGGDEHFKYVTRWATDNSKALTGALVKIRNLELKLGQPALGETRSSRLYNYIRMSDHIKSTSQESRDRLEKVKATHRLKLANIRNNHKEKRTQITNELNRVDSEYRKTTTNLKKHFTVEEKEVANQYSSQISELQGMRDVYK